MELISAAAQQVVNWFFAGIGLLAAYLLLKRFIKS